jgi:selenide, water dikinase
LRDLPSFPDPNLIIGAATSDDAAVYRIDAERALVQTVDFFTPIVDDAWLYGQIAAANSLSDVYAMGGRPITAMNLLALPEEVPLEMANTILRGGAEKVAEAKCALAGGHSVKAPEPLYGLSVTGIVHPDRVISNAGAKVGDVLILTKPLGTGIISTAVKRELCGEELMQIAVKSMSTLNTVGAAIAEAGLCTAGTDVTGFGLLGHLGSMARESGVTAHSAPLPSPCYPTLYCSSSKAVWCQEEPRGTCDSQRPSPASEMQSLPACACSSQMRKPAVACCWQCQNSMLLKC